MDLSASDASEPASSPAPRPPRPWLAALLSVLSPGLGHVYLWRLRAALGFAALFFVASAVAIWGIVELPGAIVLIAPAAGLLALDAFIAAHAWRAARVRPVERRPSRGLLVLALVPSFFVIGFPQEMLRAWVKRNVVEAYRTPSGAMEPTILVGDFLFAKWRHGEPLARDDMYTFRRDDSFRLMRVVGLGGDTLAMRGGVLLRNGRRVEEPYARSEGEPPGTADDFAWQKTHLLDTAAASFYAPTADDWGPLVVPADSVFFLGDNRHEALDSRFAGPVAVHDVIGFPTKVYFSRDPEQGIRWERIGVRLD